MRPKKAKKNNFPRRKQTGTIRGISVSYGRFKRLFCQNCKPNNCPDFCQIKGDGCMKSSRAPVTERSPKFEVGLPDNIPISFQTFNLLVCNTVPCMKSETSVECRISAISVSCPRVCNAMPQVRVYVHGLKSTWTREVH